MMLNGKMKFKFSSNEKTGFGRINFYDTNGKIHQTKFMLDNGKAQSINYNSQGKPISIVTQNQVMSPSIFFDSSSSKNNGLQEAD